MPLRNAIAEDPVSVGGSRASTLSVAARGSLVPTRRIAPSTSGVNPPHREAANISAGSAAAGSGVRGVRQLRASQLNLAEDESESREEVEGVPWASAVPLPGAYLARAGSIPKTEERGINLQQLMEFGILAQRVLSKVVLRDTYSNGTPRIVWETANLYHLNEHFVKPLTARFRCSFVELVASKPQIPRWFVSHWWGTPFLHTQALLGFHANRREVADGSPYWICTFANNQHDLSELAGELDETPFVRAILSRNCVGTIALLDQKVTTFERIWCVLENHVSTAKGKRNHYYDIAAWLTAGSATFGGHPVPAKPTLRMDLGDGRMEEHIADEETGGAFPLAVCAKGVRIDLASAQASRPEDRRNILHMIAGTPVSEWQRKDPPSRSAAYDSINRSAHRMFAAGAMYRAVVQSDLVELKKLLEEMGDLKDDGISDGATPLYAAAWKNEEKAVTLLVEARANLDKAKTDGATPVFVAAQGGQTDALQLLCDSRADPSLARSDGVSPLFMAVQNRRHAAVKVLLAAKADANARTARGATALHLAAQEGQAPIVKSLLSGGADPELPNGSGVMPIALARAPGIIKLLSCAARDRPCGTAEGGDEGDDASANEREEEDAEIESESVSKAATPLTSTRVASSAQGPSRSASRSSQAGGSSSSGGQRRRRDGSPRTAADRGGSPQPTARRGGAPAIPVPGPGPRSRARVEVAPQPFSSSFGGALASVNGAMVDLASLEALEGDGPLPASLVGGRAMGRGSSPRKPRSRGASNARRA
eukprot:TRINITY_DN75877_c0_g1_i1.p1 TRINITY_DN75877_c0_g1~~TRINITY_DN75877_c0_g1_i1.p1  ORF type:complete len:805 (-),score=136.64 TRINITY_DN75877_c0_g1_i1:45-2348(-)